MKKSWLLILLSVLLIGLVGCEELPENKVNTPSQTGYPVGTAPVPVAYPVTNPNSATPGISSSYPGDIHVSGTLFQIMKPDNSSYALSATAFGQMAKTKVTAAGKSEEGVKLLDILTKAGISNFTKVIFSGANGRLELSRNQVNDQVIISNQNGAMVISPAVPVENWIKQITFIKVE